LRVLYGDLKLKTLSLGTLAKSGKVRVMVNGEIRRAKVEAEGEGITVTFAEPLYLKAGDEVRIRIS